MDRTESLFLPLYGLKGERIIYTEDLDILRRASISRSRVTSLEPQVIPQQLRSGLERGAVNGIEAS